MLSDEELRAIEERVGAVTPGLWKAEHYDYLSFVGAAHYGMVVELKEPWAHRRANGDFIAHAPQDVTQLLAEVRRLQGELARYQWRKVSEGLPEMEGVYRVVIVDENGNRITRNLPYSLAYYGNWVGLYYSERVTHWAEMPPLPEEGK